MMRIKQKIKRVQPKNNRIDIIVAIIFLLIALTVYKLFSLQVVNNDLYVALASNQHNVSSELEPKRGRILMRDTGQSGGGLFPLAINKDFALVYADTREITESEKTAAALYAVFDEADTVRQVEERLLEDPYFAGMDIGETGGGADEIIEFFKVKRELEIEIAKKEKISGYLTKVSKTNDPFEALRGKVGENLLASVTAMSLPGIKYYYEQHRYYPENSTGSHFLGFIGQEGHEQKGQYGLEGFFNAELAGQYGSVKAGRDALGGVRIVSGREYLKPVNGSDLVLTIERSIQYTACAKLREAVEIYAAEGGDILVVDPASGAILAMCSFPDYDPNNYRQEKNIAVFNNPAIFDQYEPGSIFKPITIAAALNEGKIAPESTYYDNGYAMVSGWPKPIKNSDYDTQGGHGLSTMTEVLRKSLNTGAIHAQQKIGADKFADYVKRFGFGEKTGIELQTENPGNIASLKRKNIRPVEAATASFGQGITVTSLQMVMSFAAIANGGILMKPYVVSEIVHEDGSRIITQPRAVERVISERTAWLLSGMMVNVLEDGHAKLAAADGYYLAGKTGTAQVADETARGYGNKTIQTFVGYGPVDDPKFVMLAKLDNPQKARFAASSAAPLFGEIAAFILQYYQVPKER